MKYELWDHPGGHPEAGGPEDAFPTLDHPPRYILMGGDHPGKPHGMLM